MEFQIIGVAKDFIQAAAPHRIYQRHAVAKARTKDRMEQVRASLVQAGDGELSRHGARPQPVDLRKDEPHPVRTLLSPSQLFMDPGKTVGLCLHKAPQLVRIVCCGIQSNRHGMYALMPSTGQVLRGRQIFIKDGDDR